MTSQVTDLSGRVAEACAECGAELRNGAKFCVTCGARTDGPAGGAQPDAPAAEAPAPAQPVAPAAPAPAKPAAPASRPAVPAPLPPSQAGLLPRFPCKLFWSPRKEWSITTGLSDAEIGEHFTRVMTSNPSVLRRANNYYRRVRWDVVRHSARGELVATCVPNGLVEVGFGQSKRLVDVSGDTIVMRIDRRSPGAKAEVSVGVGRHTTWWGIYMFPATVHAFDVVKSLKRADRVAAVRYPWSILRMVLVAASVILLIAAASSGGGGGYSSNSGSSSVPSSVPSLAPSNGSDQGGGGSAPATGPLPERPTTGDPSRMAAEINRAQQIIDDSSSSGSQLESAGRIEQLATRALQLDPGLRTEVVPALDPGAARTIKATVASAEDLSVTVAPQKKLPHWRIVAPPPAGRLLSYYRAAEAQSGVPWQYFAGIHLVETRMGRIRGDSSAGARGPMQFIAATWARYGRGDINSPRDSILAAARLLVANGAPGDMASALYRYNPHDGYVRAIERYVRLMRTDDRNYYGLYEWQVLYKRVGGTLILPVGYPRVRPVPAE
ncbi:MAG: hypothetical protein QOK04_2258 [Solirubrobacteraceae bacterium]|jgi:hypothetical protein|nr:hypothetical protein [Solirubrobacteraceae bacterium]